LCTTWLAAAFSFQVPERSGVWAISAPLKVSASSPSSVVRIVFRSYS
jgi:hypothetical protein